MRSGLGAIWGVAGLLLLALSGGAQAGGAVAMATDVEGKVALVQGHSRQELIILSEIWPGTQVELEKGAHATVVYLDSGQEYRLTGPAVVLFETGQPKAKRGNKPKKGGVALAKGGSDVRIRPLTATPAAIVMREVDTGRRLKLLGLVATKTLEMRPVFKWLPLQEGLHYQFELLDDTGKTVYSTDTTATSMALPEQLMLKAETEYTWVVSTTLPDGSRYSNVGDFRIASAALREQAGKLRPAESATVSERVVYANWLEQMELRDAARAYWLEVAKERRGASRKVKAILEK